MTDRKHMPGPWRVGHRVGGRIAVLSSGGMIVALCDEEANAHLIATTWELLDALQAMHDAYPASGASMNSAQAAASAKALAAIAKAI